MIDLSGYRMGDKMAAALATAIPRMAEQGVTLRELRLAKNLTSSSSKGAVALCEAIESCPELELLDLSGNMLRKEGGAALQECVGCLNSLAELHIADIHLDDTTMAGLIKSFCSMPELTALDLSDNQMAARHGRPSKGYQPSQVSY